MNRKEQGAQLQEWLGLKTPPIAIAFEETAPSDIARVNSAEPAGCGYWRLAAEGQVFYTESSDHYNCPIGAHTHGVALPTEQAKQLETLIQTMVGLEYLKMEDVPTIPHRTEPFRVAVYAPLDKTPCEPDVILIRGNGRQMMLLVEAAWAAGIAGDSPTMGRPTCAVIPQAIQSGKTVTSFGCIGNRLYTGATDDESYFAVPGTHLPSLLDKLATMIGANRELETFHRGRIAGGQA